MVNQVSDVAIQNSKAAHPSISPGIYNLKPNPKPLPKQGTWIRFQRPVCLENFDTNGSLAIQGKRTKKAIDSSPSYQTINSRFQWWKSPLQSNWWRLLNNLAKSNEPISLELSWAWKPTYRERAQ